MASQRHNELRNCNHCAMTNNTLKLSIKVLQKKIFLFFFFGFHAEYDVDRIVYLLTVSGHCEMGISKEKTIIYQIKGLKFLLQCKSVWNKQKILVAHCGGKLGWSSQYWVVHWGNYFLCTFDNICCCWCHIEGILPKGPYLPCISMAGRALSAGYPRYILRWQRFYVSQPTIQLDC